MYIDRLAPHEIESTGTELVNNCTVDLALHFWLPSLSRICLLYYYKCGHCSVSYHIMVNSNIYCRCNKYCLVYLPLKKINKCGTGLRS